jgi:hypothetical protein
LFARPVFKAMTAEVFKTTLTDMLPVITTAAKVRPPDAAITFVSSFHFRRRLQLWCWCCTRTRFGPSASAHFTRMLPLFFLRCSSALTSCRSNLQILLAGAAYWFYRRNRNAAA